MIVLSDENSLFGADVYIEADKDVPGATMDSLSGTFHAKVFEGPYSKIRCWVKEMESLLKAKGKAMKQLYFYYTTCPRVRQEVRQELRGDFGPHLSGPGEGDRDPLTRWAASG